MTWVPFSSWWCLRCGRSYSPTYDGRCVTRLVHQDGRRERCPGPLIRIDVQATDSQLAAA